MFAFTTICLGNHRSLWRARGRIVAQKSERYAVEKTLPSFHNEFVKLYYDTFSTAFGRFSVAVDESGTVIATTFGDKDSLRVPNSKELTHSPIQAAQARRELTEFLCGERQEFTVKVAPHGTEFQKKVWSVLGEIPFGETCSYGELAAKVGNPKASRAVGQANGSNPICLIVPCHRCIGADGSLTGFGFGEAMKRRLLDLEAAAAASCQT
jgi:methylated-DNA-[protein]-cysteine S-methyltransferase